MTICIAAIGTYGDHNERKEAIVFATDHMITMPQIGQFEHAIEKYRKINSRTVAMLAGETLLFESLVDGVRNSDSFNQVKQKIHENFKKVKDERIKTQVLDKFKLDAEFIKELLKQPEHNDTTFEILNFLKQFNLQTVIILVGFENGQAQIAEISENAAVNARDINFDAIGSGGSQAINTLLFQKHSKKADLKSTLYNVYKAKRNAEVAVGVGKETELFILTEEKMHEVNESQKKLLAEIYDAEMRFGKDNEKLIKVITELGVEA